MIMPLVILIIVGALHLAICLHNQVIDLAEQEVAVKEIDPVNAMYGRDINN